MLGYWFASYTDFAGLQYISAQFERLILFTYPLFVVVLGAASLFGISLTPETIGDPSDPPLLLVMGLGMQMVGWHPDFCRELAAAGLTPVGIDLSFGMLANARTSAPLLDAGVIGIGVQGHCAHLTSAGALAVEVLLVDPRVRRQPRRVGISGSQFAEPVREEAAEDQLPGEALDVDRTIRAVVSVEGLDLLDIQRAMVRIRTA